MAEPLLQVRELTTRFRSGKKELAVVDGVSFEVGRGETLAIVGESGAGKSVTSLSIMRLLPARSASIAGGEILFEGRDLVRLSEAQMSALRGNQIAMIFQEPMSALNPVLTIGEQVSEVLRRHRAMSRPQALQAAAQLLRRVGFARAEETLDEYPHRLSGGMRQRVMIAMATACDPKLLIADEPTTALDVTVQAQVLELMRALAADSATAILLITHNLGVVAELADRVLIMYAGQIVEEAGVVELFDQPAHPYTQGLLSSVPRLDDDGRRRLTSIPGSVPAPDAFPRGCRFSTRCPAVMPQCRRELPELAEIAPGHRVRCFLHGSRVAS